MKKILILQPPSDSGCDWYRLKQFAVSAKQQNLIDVQFLDLSLPLSQLSQAIDSADGYIIRLTDSVAHEVLDQFNWDEIDKPIFVDIDDNYEIPDPFSDMYKVYGTQEVVLTDGSYLWKEGEHFSIQKNTKRLEKFKSVLRKCTSIIVTTFELKSYAEQYNKNVVIIPNAIDFSIFPEVKDPNKKEVRLLWAGGSTHYPDLAEIKDSLTRLMHSNLNLHFYMLGVAFHGIIKDLPKERVHTFGWIKPDGHGYRLACLDADIGICPLKTVSFNTYKSSVKYYEYSALRMATVAKNISPYKDDIVDGVSGLLYSTPQEFEQQVQRLIDNPIERIQLAQGGYEYTEKNRSVPEIAKDWGTFLSEVVEVVNKSKFTRSKPHEKLKTGSLNIVLACRQFKSLTGSELYYYELAREYLKLGHSVTIVANGIGNPLKSKVEKLGGKVVKLGADIKPDIIIASHEPIRKLLKHDCPIIQVVHSENDYLWQVEKPIPGCNHYVAVRDSIKDRIISEGVPEDMVSVIWNPIDLGRFTSTDTHNGTLLFVGSLDGLREKVIEDVKIRAKELNLEPLFIGNDRKTWNVENYVRECAMTASVYMGRTTLEGYACNKPGLIYEIDGRGRILSYTIEKPQDTDKFNSILVAQRILSLC